MKALIFGSNGYLGRNLYHYLNTRDVQLKCFDIQELSKDLNTIYEQIDITIPADFSGIDVKVDSIYFFAGLTGTSQGFESYSQYIDTNEKGLLNLLSEMVKQNSRARIIFPSTRLVYEGQKNKLLCEKSTLNPKTIYAINKLSCENILSAFRNSFDINYTVFRICVPYGHLVEGETSYGTLGFFLNNAKMNKNISLFGDGELRRTFTHIEDICQQIYLSVDNEDANGQIYNIGGDNATLKYVALQIANRYGVEVEYVDWPESALKIESGDTIFDGKKLAQLTGASLTHNIYDWLK